MAVLVLDLAVLPMHHQLRMLVLCNFPRPIHRVLLSVEVFGVFFGARPSDCPLIVSGDDVLIAICHLMLLVRSRIAAIWVCGHLFKRGQIALNVRVLAYSPHIQQ